MTDMRVALTLGIAAFTAACAGGTGSGAAPAPSPAPAPPPAATQVMQQAATASAAPAAARDIDPSGNFNVALSYGGQPLNIYLQMWKRTDGSGYSGSISAEGVPTIALNGVTVKGNAVTATLSAPDGAAITMDFTITGNDLSGSWKSNAGDGSQMTGKRAP
jgi:hypothetical protein